MVGKERVQVPSEGVLLIKGVTYELFWATHNAQGFILTLSQARCKMSVCDDYYLDNKRLLTVRMRKTCARTVYCLQEKHSKYVYKKQPCFSFLPQAPHFHFYFPRLFRFFGFTFCVLPKPTPKPSAPKEANSLPRDPISPIMAFHLALGTSDPFLSASLRL